MKLADWLKQTGTKRYAFAEMIGVQASMISDYCSGRTWPGRDKVEAIIKATNGAVTANDLLSEEARAMIEAAQ